MEINHDLLTLDEQLELGRRIQQGDSDALAALVEGNVRLVHKIACKFFSDDPATAYDDLVQAGMIGLLTAARKYDPERGLHFSTYAVWWIRQAVSRAAITSGLIPRSANPNYEHQNATSAEIQARRKQPILSLDAPLRNRRGDEGENTLADMLPSAGQSVEDKVLSDIEFERLFDALRLDERGQAAIRAWLSGLSREEAGKMYGISRSWVYFVVSTRRKRLTPPLLSTMCIEPDCREQRMVTPNGTRLTRCEKHQREYCDQAAQIRSAHESSRRRDV